MRYQAAPRPVTDPILPVCPTSPPVHASGSDRRRRMAGGPGHDGRRRRGPAHRGREHDGKRAAGIEPAPRAWKARMQPLHHARALRRSIGLRHPQELTDQAGQPGFEPELMVLETIVLTVDTTAP